MTETLTLARFRELADAYGGVIARWPAAYRAAAAELARDRAAASVLAAALELDELLDGWQVPAASSALAERVILAAPAARPRTIRRVRLWWSGLGVAAALAGATTGVGAVMLVASTDAVAGGATSFGDVASGEG